MYQHNYSSNFINKLSEEIYESNPVSKIAIIIFMAAIAGCCLAILFPKKNQNQFIGTRVGNMYFGDTVSIHGLNRGECYNDRLATIISHDATTGRYVVRLKKDLTYISVKPQNLEVMY